MFKNFPSSIINEFLSSVIFAFILFFMAFVVLVSSSHAQQWQPSGYCSSTANCNGCRSYAQSDAASCGGVWATFPYSGGGADTVCSHLCSASC
ncbi:MAG TPA: hypothetical protein VLE50_01085, partial [Cellvibrio sp.]|nr:hypothetical protein [Cellvibrio sp.]